MLGLSHNLCGWQKATDLLYLVDPSPLTWAEMRQAMAGTKCADPRDRVYGMLAIINTNQTGLPNVDYSLSVAEVYTAAAANYFQKAEYLDLLASCDLASDHTRAAKLDSGLFDQS